MNVERRIRTIKSQTEFERKKLSALHNETALVKKKREIRKQRKIRFENIVSVFRQISLFKFMSDEAIYQVTESIQEITYHKGDIIIKQGDIGDTFYLLEEGKVSVTQNTTNPSTGVTSTREIVQLGRNSYFGELSLLNEDVRAATVTVISEMAAVGKISKKNLDEIKSRFNCGETKQMVVNNEILTKTFLDKIPLFKVLRVDKQKILLNGLKTIHFAAGSYLCRQGIPGSYLFVLTSGQCNMLIPDENTGTERTEVLTAGSCFGEMALMDSVDQRQTFNIISTTSVETLALHRKDYYSLVSDSEPQARLESTKRRISTFGENHKVSTHMAKSFFRRLGRFMVESLWNSMYSKLYRKILLSGQSKLFPDFGLRDSQGGVQGLRNKCKEALRIDPLRRSPADRLLVHELLLVQGGLRRALRKPWQLPQFQRLTNTARLVLLDHFERLTTGEGGDRRLFIILRGTVRLYGRDNNEFEELCSGESFGTADEEVSVRAMAITKVELISLRHSDVVHIDRMFPRHVDVASLLRQVPLLKDWNNRFDLCQISKLFCQERFEKGVVLLRKGLPAENLYILLSGRLDVFYSLDDIIPVTVTTVQVGEMFGESGLVNSQKHIAKKIHEEFHTVCATAAVALLIPPKHYGLLNAAEREQIAQAYHAKKGFRRLRVATCRLGRSLDCPGNLLALDTAGRLRLEAADALAEAKRCDGSDGPDPPAEAVDEHSGLYCSFAEMTYANKLEIAKRAYNEQGQSAAPQPRLPPQQTLRRTRLSAPSLSAPSFSVPSLAAPSLSAPSPSRCRPNSANNSNQVILTFKSLCSLVRSPKREGDQTRPSPPSPKEPGITLWPHTRPETDIQPYFSHAESLPQGVSSPSPSGGQWADRLSGGPERRREAGSRPQSECGRRQRVQISVSSARLETALLFGSSGLPTALSLGKRS